MFHKLVAFLGLFLLTLRAIAQDTGGQVEMADRMRADGKIWVVVAVIAVTFFGIVIYLIQLDGKIGKLEKELKK